MEEHIVRILEIQVLTHDVKRYRVQKPEGYRFEPGQATEVAIHKPGWEGESRPFTFTSLNEAPHLEFTIKSYRDHEGVTKLLDTLVPGDELILHDVWGAIQYRGPGLFLAGGAGITPFLAIFRDLKNRGMLEGNRLLFANKTSGDIILGTELKALLGTSLRHVLSEERVSGHEHGFLTKDLIQAWWRPGDFVYLCGPDPMMDAVQGFLKSLGLGEKQIIVEL